MCLSVFLLLTAYYILKTGIWISLLANRMAFSFGLSHGKEEDLIYFIGGFGF